MSASTFEENHSVDVKNQSIATRLIAGTWLNWPLLLFCLFAWAGTAVLMTRAVTQLSRFNELIVAVASGLLLAASVVLFKRWFRATPFTFTQFFTRHGLFLALALGLILRLAWILAFPAQPSSDGMSYLILAQKINVGEQYELAGTLAYWPPGYAFFLAPWIRYLEPAIAVPLSQLFLFVVSIAGVHQLTIKLATRQAASCAALLFAVWPNLVAHCATPEKEMLVAALLIWAFTLVLSKRPISYFFVGISLGAAILVQPSTQFLLLPIAILIGLKSSQKSPLAVGLLVVGAALIVTPWTVRNYQKLDTFKLVSTNGGDNLYRANNPLATGGYTDTGAIDLSGLSELKRDDTAKILAVRWITEHPAAFLSLMLEKQFRFMGDDAAGVYSTFRAEGSQRSNKLYFPIKLAANAWWLATWFVIACLLLSGKKLGKAQFLVWGWIYFFTLHSVFEAAGKYHVPILWIMCVMLGILISDGVNIPKASADKPSKPLN